jgi:hypothetical protein
MRMAPLLVPYATTYSTMVALATLMFLFASPPPSQAQHSVQSAQPAPTSSSIVLPAGVSVPVVSTSDLNSRTGKVGDTIDFRVYQDVISGGVVAIPAGTLAIGKIVAVRRAGAFGRSGSLSITCDSVTLANGTVISTQIVPAIKAAGRDVSGSAAIGGIVVGATVYTITNFNISFSNLFSSNKPSDAPAVAAGLATAILVAAIFQGGNAKIPLGTHFTAVLSKSVSLLPSN